MAGSLRYIIVESNKPWIILSLINICAKHSKIPEKGPGRCRGHLSSSLMNSFVHRCVRQPSQPSPHSPSLSWGRENILLPSTYHLLLLPSAPPQVKSKVFAVSQAEVWILALALTSQVIKGNLLNHLEPHLSLFKEYVIIILWGLLWRWCMSRA